MSYSNNTKCPLTVFEITEVVRKWAMFRAEIPEEKFNKKMWLEEVEYLDAMLVEAIEAKAISNEPPEVHP